MAEMKKYLDTTALSTLVDQIKAEDAKVKAYADAQIEAAGKTYDVAGAAATAESNAKAYTDALANGAVATNTANIATLNGTGEGSVAKAVADAKTLIDADIDAVEAKADQNTADIATINDATNGILAQAKAYTDEEDNKIETALAELDTYVGDIPVDAEGNPVAASVIAYVNKKTEGIATDTALAELQDAVDAVEADVATIKGDYLKAADKTELEGKITTAQTAADNAQSHSEGVASDLADAIEALEAADAGQVERIAALEGTIVGLSGAMHFEGVKDAVPTDVTGYEQGDVIIVGNKEYVLNGDAFVEFGDASVNAEAITALTGRVNTLETDMGTAKTDINNVESAVATKAEQTALDEAVEALEGADSALSGRISTLEAAVGESGSVAEDIATAKQEAIDAAATDSSNKDAVVLSEAQKYTDEKNTAMDTRVAALEEAVEDYASASDLTALTTRVTTAEGEIDTLQAEMDAVEALAAANKTAHEANAAAIALKAAQTDLDNAVARIAQNETDIDALETAVADKADADDLTAAVARIAANETAIAANTSAINSFTPITSDEVNALFA